MSSRLEAQLLLHPIGRVTQGRTPGDQGDAWEHAESEIELDMAWTDALDGIDGFSHVWVLWWLDRAGDPPLPLRVHPQRRDDLPLVGLFATRSPARPNPVAITAVRLVSRQGARLLVVGLDAYSGTPVLDIKPYLRRGDLIPEAGVPGWIERLGQAEAQCPAAPWPAGPGAPGDLLGGIRSSCDSEG